MSTLKTLIRNAKVHSDALRQALDNVAEEHPDHGVSVYSAYTAAAALMRAAHGLIESYEDRPNEIEDLRASLDAEIEQLSEFIRTEWDR